MSFAPAIHKTMGWMDPMQKNILGKKFGDQTDLAYQAFKPKTPPPTPGVPNPNDAANAAQSQMDAMRQRRGLMANIFAGASSTAPVSGKQQLGT